MNLTENLFYGTSIATNILVLKKNKLDSSVLFIDASKEFIKITNNNKLTDSNIQHIVEMFTNRSDVEYFARLATYDEIKEQEYNLSVGTYVEKEDTREVVNIVKLNAEIKEIVAHEEALRREIDKIISEIESN